MAKLKDEKIKIKDEPGAEARFMRGVRKALVTPPTPHEKVRPKSRISKLNYAAVETRLAEIILEQSKTFPPVRKPGR